MDNTMTLEKYIIKYCEDRGMFDTQAYDIVNILKSNYSDLKITNKFNDYPKSIIFILNKLINITSIKYIEETCPEAWFKPLFMTEKDREKFIQDLNSTTEEFLN